ncbi:MAG: LysM peptidoglycan-binding domain-containing protein [Endomicrobiia bacterium]
MKKVIVLLFIFSFYCFGSIEYVVVKGDCLWNIAKRFYQNPFLWPNIYEANKHQIRNPDLIYPGQVFILPDIEVSEETDEKKAQFLSEQEIEEGQVKEVQHDSEEFLEKDVKEEMFEEEKIFHEISEKSEEEKKYKEKNHQEISEFPQKIKLEEFEFQGKIVAAKEEKFVYIDFDKIYCELKDMTGIYEGKILGIYHLGPSKYDINLMKIPKNQLILVGKAKVLEILDDNKVLCEILRVYSPVAIGDFIKK